MNKGIIYVMTTAVPGLIKIGKTGSSNFEQRMYDLEHNGYRNVTALKRTLAIEVDDYDAKEKLIHIIFEKSRLSDTELFAVDINIVEQLLFSFECKVVFPKDESKEELFDEAVDNSNSKMIPDGKYHFSRKKKSDGKTVEATAVIKKGYWTLLKGSILGITENSGVSNKAKMLRLTMPIDENGVLLDDVDLGQCTPSFAGSIVMNAANDGWVNWKNSDDELVDKYRKVVEDSES